MNSELADPVPLDPTARVFAIVPAAGHSRRMGRPKLLLPFGNSTVIHRMLTVLRRPEIAQILVVVRPDDELLRAAVETAGGTPLQPDRSPPEMRDSVEYGLREVLRRWHPGPQDAWLLVPADHPLLGGIVLDDVLRAWRQAPGRIIVPVHQGKRGHPTLFPMALADAVFQLPADQGLNSLLKRAGADILELSTADAGVVLDLDTPEDYARCQPPP